jgi:ssDNA-binding Zn-finger/Zn-ribbon topoisomerase 1
MSYNTSHKTELELRIERYRWTLAFYSACQCTECHNTYQHARAALVQFLRHTTPGVEAAQAELFIDKHLTWQPTATSYKNLLTSWS